MNAILPHCALALFGSHGGVVAVGQIQSMDSTGIDLVTVCVQPVMDDLDERASGSWQHLVCGRRDHHGLATPFCRVQDAGLETS